MNLTCTHLQDDWELYALGSLPEDVQEAMDAHLESGCRGCRQRYFEAQAALTAMSNLAPTLRPSASVERKLMQAIRAEAPAAPAWAFWKAVPWAAAFAGLLLVLWFAQDRGHLQAQLAQSRQTAEQARQNQAALQAQLEAALQADAALQGQKNGGTPANAVPTAMPTASSSGEARLKAQLAAAQQQIQMAQSDKAALAQQLDQLQSEMAAAAMRTASLENDLHNAQLQAKQAQEKAALAQASPEQTALLAAELAQAKDEVRRLSAAAGNGAKIERLLQSASLQEISLRGVLPQAGHATARALYSPQGGLLLLADSLPKLPDQKCYQLWLIRKGAPAIVSGGLVTLHDDGKGILFAPPSNDLTEITALAITDEPAGGSVSSRGRKLLFGAQ